MSKNKENKKIHFNNCDFMQQYLLLLDLWQQPYTSPEFCNQIIEGESIEFLIWLYTENKETNSAKPTTTKAQELLLSNFNSKIFSFNLLYKLGKESEACRAEIGRLNGIKKILDLINSESNSDKEKLVELLSFIG